MKNVWLLTIALWVVFGGFFALGVKRCMREKEVVRAALERPLLPMATSSADAADEADRAALRRRDAEIRACYADGGVVAMGFSFHVVCITGGATEYDVHHDTRRKAGRR